MGPGWQPRVARAQQGQDIVLHPFLGSFGVFGKPQGTMGIQDRQHQDDISLVNMVLLVFLLGVFQPPCVRMSVIQCSGNISYGAAPFGSVLQPTKVSWPETSVVHASFNCLPFPTFSVFTNKQMQQLSNEEAPRHQIDYEIQNMCKKYCSLAWKE